ncbi:electron transport complex subunit C [Mizugakiibacter sediminis]|uniref:Electron transport complex subunit C n=1 Tax=Mizugakiibacter sediminis TaxID=1475481 RepID=A0A0K8QNF9_9GAMM|nr:electron transport complex subunit C [Mizugakiibacter sediminis]
MYALSDAHVQNVSGGGWGDAIGAAVVGWAVGKVLDAAASAIASQNQGGTAFEEGDSTLPANVYGT